MSQSPPPASEESPSGGPLLRRRTSVVIVREPRRPWLPKLFIIAVFAMSGVLMLLTMLDAQAAANRSVDPYAGLHRVYNAKQVPFHVVPVHYDIHLKLFFPMDDTFNYGDRNWTYDGDMKMRLDVRVSTRRIILHCADPVNIKSMTLYPSMAGMVIHRTRFTLRPDWQLLDIETDDLLESGREYRLDIKFGGSIHKDGRYLGLYASDYVVDGQTRYALVTHVQPSQARTIFPCFDNPMAKAVFRTKLTHPAGTHALSNMDNVSISESEDGGHHWITTTFRDSLKMSTYLFAFTVSDFPCLTTRHKDIPIRVFVESSKMKDAREVVDLLPQMIAFFEDYFDIPYMLPKLDVFGSPHMNVAAMENWGLIISRETHILFNKQIYAQYQMRNAADIMAHEISHQWFGNLVTMSWWNDLWLNEGFASFMGQMASDAVMNMTQRNDETFAALMATTLRFDTRPDVQPAMSSKAADRKPQDYFNSITYRKANLIIRLIEHLITPDVFRDSIRKYLKKYQFTNADDADLFAMLIETHDNVEGSQLMASANFTFKAAMSTFIYQPGPPNLFVRHRNDSDTSVILSQVESQLPGTPLHSGDTVYNGDNHRKSGTGLQWKVPIVGRNADNSQRITWIGENRTIDYDMGDDIAVDMSSRTYGRIIYDTVLYERIIEVIRNDFNSVPTPTRIRLIDDTFTLAETKVISYTIPLRLSYYMLNDTHFVYFRLMMQHLDAILIYTNFLPQGGLIEKFTIRIFEPKFEESIRLDDEPVFYQDKLRELTLMQLCTKGHEKCIAWCLGQFDKLKALPNCSNVPLSNATCNNIPPYLRHPVYHVAVQFGSEANFDFLYEKASSYMAMESYHEERDRISQALVRTPFKDKFKKIMTSIIFVGSVTPADLRLHVIEMSRIKRPTNYFLSYIEENFEHLADRLDKEKFALISNLYVNIASYREMNLETIERVCDIANATIQANGWEPREFRNLSPAHIQLRIKRNEAWRKMNAHRVLEAFVQLNETLALSDDMF